MVGVPPPHQPFYGTRAAQKGLARPARTQGQEGERKRRRSSRPLTNSILATTWALATLLSFASPAPNALWSPPPPARRARAVVATSSASNVMRFLRGGMFGGLPMMNPNSDVLDAEPADPESKEKLVDELVRRGSLAKDRYDLKTADSLFTCALGHNETNAYVFTLRAEVRHAMGRMEDALEDTEQALNLDDHDYMAHKIRGQVQMRLGDYEEATEHLEFAYALNERDEGIPSLLSKCEEEKKKKGPLVPATLPAVRTKEKMPAKEEEIVKDSSEADSSDEKIMKGYKLRADGSKTSYFTHEMTEQERRLAGEFKPKEISVNEAKRMEQEALEREKSGGSWWAGGTWEEINMEQWIRSEITSRVSSVTMKIPQNDDYTLKVEKIEEWNGGGYIMVKGGRKKYIMDVSFKVFWTAESRYGSDEAVLGHLLYTDVTNSELEDKNVNPKIVIRTPLKEPTKSIYDNVMKDFNTKIQDILESVLAELRAK
mmetsp:Transcript_14390/g.35086  ORF Transcript_14390/g.35086 Transcript_14390/m.35086 type:complete len:486 (-) Transcript_14390:168-1625(-)|eukprot:CAMPEP_0114509902 /NCGR_PEP_ID=MMETSP0109-20121206/13477_1 /TAXON_ID=29199 /ORGANISM="Chlorarachnion reptans, Strain CCCM449" /LENGTH=485 /DNA_ID=CAMNT_0001689125 /DNA_START=38 /DNA_END=1498 /DNA_ORIENTATION=-